MKKFIKSILIAAALTLLPAKVFATGGFSISTGSITLHPGESATFAVTANNATGKIDVASSNPSVASVSASAIFLDLNSETITVSANAVGSATISVIASAEFATYDEEILAGVTKTITVSVVELPPAPAPTPTPSSTAAPASSPASSSASAPSSEQPVVEQKPEVEKAEPVSAEVKTTGSSAENSSYYEVSENTDSFSIDPLPILAIISIVEGCALAVIAVLYFYHRNKPTGRPGGIV